MRLSRVAAMRQEQEQEYDPEATYLKPDEAEAGDRVEIVCAGCFSSDIYYTGCVLWSAEKQEHIIDGFHDARCGQCDGDCNTMDALAPPRGLFELARYLDRGVVWAGAPRMGPCIDFTNLPVFGGRPPRKDLTNIWSWDEHSVLIGTVVTDDSGTDTTKFTGISREHLDQALPLKD